MTCDAHLVFAPPAPGDEPGLMMQLTRNDEIKIPCMEPHHKDTPHRVWFSGYTYTWGRNVNLTITYDPKAVLRGE